MAHSEKKNERYMVNDEELGSQRIIGFPCTVYLTLCALRLALCVMSRVLWVRILSFPIKKGPAGRRSDRVLGCQAVEWFQIRRRSLVGYPLVLSALG